MVRRFYFPFLSALFLLASCSAGNGRVTVEEVPVAGGLADIGDDIDCARYQARIEDLYAAKYETTWEAFTQVMNYGIRKKYVRVSEGKLVPLVGLFPQFNNAIMDLDARSEDISLENGRISCVPSSANKPVTNIGWYGAALFCNILSEMNGLQPSYDLQDWSYAEGATGYRLPTFEEWEYIARGGPRAESHAYAGSDDPRAVGWFAINSDNRVHPVGELLPNSLGIYDLSGNVNEFCTETYKPIITAARTAGSALKTSNRIWRGGSFISDTETVRFFRQNINNPDYYFPFSDVGFRLVRRRSK